MDKITRLLIIVLAVIAFLPMVFVGPDPMERGGFANLGFNPHCKGLFSYWGTKPTMDVGDYYMVCWDGCLEEYYRAGAFCDTNGLVDPINSVASAKCECRQMNHPKGRIPLVPPPRENVRHAARDHPATVVPGRHIIRLKSHGDQDPISGGRTGPPERKLASRQINPTRSHPLKWPLRVYFVVMISLAVILSVLIVIRMYRDWVRALKTDNGIALTVRERHGSDAEGSDSEGSEVQPLAPDEQQ